MTKGQLAALLAETQAIREKARADTERLDWLEEDMRDSWYDSEQATTLCLDGPMFTLIGFRQNARAATVRAVIDAAMLQASQDR